MNQDVDIDDASFVPDALASMHNTHPLAIEA